MNLKRPLLFLLIGIALATGVRAQAPQRVSYQAVVCHANNRPASNEEVTLRLSVLLHRSNGDSVVYSEMHTTTTNPNGVLAVYLGAGTPTTSQRLSDIEWSRGDYLLRSELDPEGTKDYSSTIANSIVSVPYALHANSAGHADTAHEALHLRGLHDTLRIAFDTLVSKKQMNAALNLKSNLHHTHPTEDIEGLSAILSGKASNADLAVLATSLAAKADTSVLDSLASDRELNSARTSLQGAIGGKADTNHRHAVADIDGLSSVLATQVTVHALDTLASIRHLDNVRTALQTSIDSKIDTDALDTLASDRELNSARTNLQSAINGKADTNHGHRIDDVSGLRTELNSKASTASLAGLASSLSLKVNANALDTLASDRELNNARNDLQNAINGKADTNHGHRIDDVSGLRTELNGKASTASLAGLASSLSLKVNADALDTLASDRELNNARTDLQNAINGKADTNHGHGIDDVSGLRTELNGKASTASLAGLASSLSFKVNANALDTLASDRELNNARNALQAGINGKADTNHSHEVGDINGLSSILASQVNADALDTLASDRELNNVRNDLQNAINGKADTNHGHGIDDVSGLRTELNGKASTASLAGLASSLSLKVNANALDTLASDRELNSARNDLQNAINGKADTNHNHEVGDINGLSSILASQVNADALDTLASDRELNSARNDLQNAINGKADTNHGHGIDDVSGLRTELNGKASTASLVGLSSSLSHKVDANALDTLASDRELNNARNALQAGINGKADTNHSHRIGNIDGLNAALNSKANRLNVEIMANTLRRKTDSIAVANTIHDSLAAHCYVSCSHLESICRSYDSVIDRMQRSMDVLRSAIAEFVVTTEDEGCECTGTSIAVDGALPGLFSVSATKRVRFSMGNLMYSNSGRHECADGSIQDGTFRFADCACEYIGSSNRFSSSTFIGWIDFFGWGTSGYHNEDDPYNVNYYPYSTATAIVNTSYNTYGYGPSRGNNNWSINLIDASKYYDWGVYNAISNGGNQPGLWRVLTQDEWRYLAYTRTASTIGDTVNARFCKATVREVSGLILFPDNYTHPDGVPTPQKCNATGRNAANQPDPDATYTANNYNTEEWQAMEAAGAVFLPAAGWRDDSGNILKTNINGNYWSSTTSNQSSAKYFNFEPDQMQFNPAASKHRGRNVRLVQDVE